MPEKRRLEIGDIVSIQKPILNDLLRNLQAAGYETIGPMVKDDSLVYEHFENLEQLPHGYATEQGPGHFRLMASGQHRYFDFIPGSQSWKQFLFPPRLELLTLQRSGEGWKTSPLAPEKTRLAFIGVRACELTAIQIQDRAFIREDFTDPFYRSRRSRVFILAVNCLHPAGTCFCTSMGTGPRVHEGSDLSLTELDDVFLVTVGSELGRGMFADLAFEPASAYLLAAADHGLEQAAEAARAEVDPEKCSESILNRLEDPRWQEVASRCLSCGNCTLACPTCFCWDVTDQMTLDGKETRRERVWDSCFNPGYSYQAGGNTRPTIRSRYRQWLSHKFGSWKQQYGTVGCVGCGRCITWCPAGIDTREEVAALQLEVVR